MSIRQNRDARIPVIPFNEPEMLVGRFFGSSGVSPTGFVSGTNKSGCSVVRNSQGNYSIVIGSPVGQIQWADVQLNSSVTGAIKNVVVVPFPNVGQALGATGVNFYLQTASGTAIDIATGTDEINFMIWTSTAQVP